MKVGLTVACGSQRMRRRITSHGGDAVAARLSLTGDDYENEPRTNRKRLAPAVDAAKFRINERILEP